MGQGICRQDQASDVRRNGAARDSTLYVQAESIGRRNGDRCNRHEEISVLTELHQARTAEQRLQVQQEESQGDSRRL